MDAPVVPPEKYGDIIRQIESINKLTGGYRPVLRWLQKHISQQPLTIVDLGCGRGGLLREMAKICGSDVRLIGIDNNPWAIAAARTTNTSIEYQITDIFSHHDLPEADFIVCSHTTHHLTNTEIIKLLQLLEAKAKRGWFICDLHRHAIPYLFTRGMMALLPVNPMVAHDGPLSVCRAFKREEWHKLIKEASLSSPVRIEWFFPFRYGISSRKDRHEKI